MPGLIGGHRDARRPADRRRHPARRARVPRPPARRSWLTRRRGRADGRPADPDRALRAGLDVAPRSCSRSSRATWRRPRPRSARSCRSTCPTRSTTSSSSGSRTCRSIPTAQPWLGRAIVLTEPDGTRRIIGSAGFHAPPGPDGRVEVGYRVEPGVPAPGRRDRGRPGPVRLGARQRRRSLPGVGRAGQRAPRWRSSGASASRRSASRSTTSTARSWSSSSTAGRPPAGRRCHAPATRRP